MSAPLAPPVDLVEMLRRQVAARPGAPCLTWEDDRIDFAELDRRSDRVAAALARDSVGAGDRVAVLTQTAPMVLELLFGCAKAGAILAPLNWRLSAREIALVLADAEPAILFVAEELARLVPEGVGKTIALADYADWRDEPAAAVSCAVDPDAPALILYTSGTTGLPKGAMLSQRNLSYLGRMAGELWSYTPDSVNLVAMPLFHIGGIGWALLGLSQGGETVLTRQSDPQGLLDVMARHRITHTLFVPTVIQRLVDCLEKTGATPPQVANIFYGAAPIGESLLRRALATFGSNFYHAYGMTETAGTTVTLLPHDHDLDGPDAGRLRSCGRPMPWIELVLVDPATGREVAIGDVGEIRIRSPVNMLGYWRKPAETAAALTPDGWMCSGDAALRDGDGYVYIQDRYKDMIVSGGENIYPTEIDNVLHHHPDVQEVAVIGVPHPLWGETPRAYVVPRAGAVPDEAALIAFARERLAHYKCPTSVLFVDALPRNASGKLLKRELRDAAT